MKEATTKILGQELNFDVNRESVAKAIGSKMFRDRDYTDRLFQQALETSPEKETDYHIDNWKRFQEHINNKYGI